MAGGAAHLGADARQQLLHVERLGDVVVGAGVHAGDLVAPAVAGGEDDDRHLALGAAPLLEHADAVHLRQADVEDDDVVGLGLAEEVALLAVEGGIDGVARVGQRRDQLAIEIAIILDDQDAHGSSPFPLPATRGDYTLRAQGSAKNAGVVAMGGFAPFQSLVPMRAVDARCEPSCPAHPCVGPRLRGDDVPQGGRHMLSVIWRRSSGVLVRMRP